MAATRRMVTLLFLAMAIGACGGSAGADDVSAADDGITAADDRASAETPAVVETDSAFCQKAVDLGAQAEELEAEWATKEIDDVWEYWREVYGYFAGFYRELGSAAGGQLADDFDIVVTSFETMSEWQGDLTVESPLSDAEESAMTASLENISQALMDECGLGDGGISVELGDDVESQSAGGVDTSSVAGRHVVQAAGQTFEETLTGEFEVECEIFDGFAVWLYGSDFATEAHANVDGVGSHEAQIFVFANLMEYDEAVGSLQEIDGSLVIDAWGDSADGVRLVSGSFSATSADGSVTAQFTCLAWEG